MARGRTGKRATDVVLDAALVRRWLRLAVAIAERTRALVDSLNVFPVPDADTGTNVLLTLRSASDALVLLPAGADVAQTTRAAADGAVRGARGNSGLLVSQALAALADVCAEAPDPAGLRPVELVRSYERMASTTWAAVSRPVTGTLLTVAHDAAAAAAVALQESDGTAPATISSVAAAATFGAQESVVETGGLGHGPVDAGGAAFMLLLTALSDTVDAGDGEGPDAPATPDPQAVPGAPAPSPLCDVACQMLSELAVRGVPHQGLPSGEVAGASTGEFEVMYLLEATAAQAAALRSRLEDVGDSVGVVGTPDALGVGLYQVHVHTDTPRAALPRAGRARQICVHHLHPTPLVLAHDEPPLPWDAARSAEGAGHVVSLERLAAKRAERTERRHRAMSTHPSQGDAPPGGYPRPAGRTRLETGRIGVIACTRAPGLIEQLARTGAVVVLNPEREGIVRAAGDLGLAEAIVLPCDAASTGQAHEAARALAARAVVSTVAAPAGAAPAPHRSEQTPEGVQLLVCDTDDEARVLAAAVAVTDQRQGDRLSDLARRAWRAAAGIRTLALSGPDGEAEAVTRTVVGLLRDDDELLTIILGRDALPDVGALAAEAAAQASRWNPVEVVVHAGGQPAPDVLLAIE